MSDRTFGVYDAGRRHGHLARCVRGVGVTEQPPPRQPLHDARVDALQPFASFVPLGQLAKFERVMGFVSLLFAVVLASAALLFTRRR